MWDECFGSKISIDLRLSVWRAEEDLVWTSCLPLHLPIAHPNDLLSLPRLASYFLPLSRIRVLCPMSSFPNLANGPSRPLIPTLCKYIFSLPVLSRQQTKLFPDLSSLLFCSLPTELHLTLPLFVSRNYPPFKTGIVILHDRTAPPFLFRC